MKTEIVEQVVRICDNVFYNRYLENGVLSETHEIKTKIKKEVVEIFVDFFGEKHRQYIESTIQRTRLDFVYQTFGMHNSVEQYLKELRNQRFNAAVGENYKEASSFVEVANLLTQYDNLSELVKLKIPVVNQCLSDLGFRVEEVLKNDFLAAVLAMDIRELAQSWKNVSLSDDMTINQNLCLVESFVDEVKSKIYNQKVGVENEFKVLCENIYSRELDPLVIRLKPSENVYNLLLRESGDRAFCQGEHIYLNNHPTGVTVLHEFLHRIGNFENEKAKFNRLQSYQMLNEIITEYFAVLMQNKKTAQYETVIANNQTINQSMYQILLKPMQPFLDAFLPELKEARMRKLPAEEIKRVIGSQLFEEMADLCQEIVEIKNYKDFHEGMQRLGLFDNGIANSNGAATQLLINEANQSLSEAKTQLEQVVSAVLKKQPFRKKLSLLVCNKTQELTKKLEGHHNTRLRKFAISLKGFTQKIEQVIEKNALQKLSTPLQEL
ncbi:MAG: hypothetical protein IKT33_03710 [Clostridia bacterium]|nr:hypothetical protein [Clostridia bacterium]